MLVNILSSPTFKPQFWQPYQADAAPRALDADGPAAQTAAPLRYSADLHGPHADFCLGPDFDSYKEEVRAHLSFLADFCRTHQAPDAESIGNNLQAFFAHRFDDPHYFDTRAELIDSVGKQSLDEFCSMIRHGSMDRSGKIAAIRDLAMGVTQCADGALSHLAGAARQLAKTAGGLGGQLWAVKEQVAREVIRELTQNAFAALPHYIRNQVHYVSTAWNEVAGDYGFDQDPDGIVMPEARQADFRRLCAGRLKESLSPDNLALFIAEACQARFNSAVLAATGQARGTWTAAIEKLFTDTLQDIGDAYGLNADDRLDYDPVSQSWQLMDSDLRLKSFVKLQEQDDGDAHYALRTEPALVALDVLRGMARLNLLQEPSGPRLLETWRETDGGVAAIIVYGGLACVARASTQDALRTPPWANRQADIEATTVSDLLQCQAGKRPGQAPLEVVVCQAIRASDIDQLAALPAHWLSTRRSIGLLLQRLGPEPATAYVLGNAADLGRGLAVLVRQRLLADLFDMGLGKAIPALLEKWHASPGKRIDAVYDVLHEHAMPLLHVAMQQEDPETAVRDWYGSLRASGLISLVAPRLGALLEHRSLGYSAFGRALRHGRTAGVEAFFFVLKDLAQDPAMQPHIKDALPRLLSATDNLAPGVVSAMEGGHARAVQAFYAGLKDLLTEPAYAGPIRGSLFAALPDLLVGKSRHSFSGLFYAVGNGHTSVVTVFHDFVRELMENATVGPLIRSALPDMLGAREARDRVGLSLARRLAHKTAIAAFEAILADPAIQPWLGNTGVPGR